MDPKKKKLIFAAVAILVLALAGGIAAYRLSGGKIRLPSFGAAKPTPPPPQTLERITFEDVKVPGVGTKALGNVAVPKEVKPSAPGSLASDRRFAVKGERGNYVPDEIIVYHNDNVIFEFKAVDADYDMTLPDIRWTSPVVPKDETFNLVFQAAVTPGKYTITCREACPFGKQAKATLIVVPRP